MKRRPLILLGLLLLIVGGAAIFTRGFGLVGGRGAEVLTLHGNVDIREVELGFRVAGRIGSMAVEEGDKVRAGQRLAVLDTASLDSRLGEAEAKVEQARAELARARSGNRAQEIGQGRARVAAAAAVARNAGLDYDRRAALIASGAISRDLWEQTRADRDRARAQLAEARQALSLLQAGSRREDVAAAEAALRAAEAARRSVATDLGDAVLTASVSGTVVTRAREPGAIVSPGETVYTLSIDRPLRLRAYVGETDLSRIGPGMAVEVSADGNPKTYRGTIGAISPRAEFTPKSVETADLRTDLVYRLRILVRDPDDGLRQGQPVTIRIPAARPAPQD